MCMPGIRLEPFPETMFEHKIMVPFGLPGTLEVVSVVEEGKYDITKVVAKVKDENGKNT